MNISSKGDVKAPECGVFAQNLTELMEGERNHSHWCRDLQIHRTQLQRFMNGESVPRPDVLGRICRYFDLDARILTHLLDDVRAMRVHSIPNFILDGLKPASHDLFPDGFYEEWRELKTASKQYCCHLLYVKTVSGRRQTKVILRETAIQQNGNINIISPIRAYPGFAVQQAGGVFLVDRPKHSADITFTGLKIGYNGDPTLFTGRKSSMRTVTSGSKLMKGATVLHYITGGFKEAMQRRRLPIFRTKAQTPKMIQTALDEIQHSDD
jgi:hypothetical protein